MTDFKVYWILCIFAVVNSDTIPTSIPNIDHYSGMSYGSSSMSIYEGALMKLGCSLPSLGNPPITWTWYCGGEIMTNVTFSSNYLKTYLNFTATWKHDRKVCYCRASSTSLFYDEASRYRYEIRVYRPWTRPFIYPLSPTTVESGENISIKCNLTTLGFPQIIMIWICDSMVPQYGTSIGTETYVEIEVTARYNGKLCRCRGLSSPSSYYAYMYTYDEVSDPVEITVL
ncbi:uncharacterized protein LOC134254731, partial [Saccostrea cucullata]|uniref:uncharacterized protein LOC134254731 n=1 Tax=Saccostrea cuccullata TaxID=36930 RepID=UPI002ED56C79